MSIKAVAICTNIPELDLGGWRSREICKKYPGSGWMPVLGQYCADDHLECLSGHEAIMRLQLGVLKPNEIAIVQEENNTQGIELRLRGGRCTVLFCLESPLYTRAFYETHLPELKKVFPHQMLFGNLGTEKVYFPSFDFENDLFHVEHVKWKDRRKQLCMVTSNKYLGGIYPGELQTLRYQAIGYFKETRKQDDIFDLYGKGWPSDYASEIPAGEKINTIKDYKYCLCIENLTMPGYVTEKIIDAMVAGVVPVYSGAPDIQEFIPEDCFVYLGLPGVPFQFEFWDQFAHWNEKHAESILHQGRRFLISDSGDRFSYQYFAKRVLQSVCSTWNIPFHLK